MKVEVTDVEYPLIDLAPALKQYREEKGITCVRLARQCKVANSVLSELNKNPRSIEKRRISTLSSMLGVLGYTPDDYDPRIRKAADAVTIIIDAYDEGIELVRIAARLGFSDVRRLHTVLESIRQDKLADATYGSVIKIASATDPAFAAWVQAYINGPLFKGRETVSERQQRLKRLQYMHDVREAQIYNKMSLQDWLHRLAGQVGFEDVDRFNPVFEGDRLTFYTDEKAYRCVITKECFTAYWTQTNTVSIRHRFKPLCQVAKQAEADTNA